MLSAGTGNLGGLGGGGGKMADLNTKHTVELCTGREWVIRWSGPAERGRTWGHQCPRMVITAMGTLVQRQLDERGKGRMGNP